MDVKKEGQINNHDILRLIITQFKNSFHFIKRMFELISVPCNGRQNYKNDLISLSNSF